MQRSLQDVETMLQRGRGAGRGVTELGGVGAAALVPARSV